MQFNGVRKDYLTVLRGRKRPAWAPIKRNILTVQGRPGGYYESTDVDPRPLQVPVQIEGDDIPDIQTLKEDLAVWLITDESKELIFDDEPDRVYFAMVDGSLDIDEFVNTGTGTISFTCPDPYKYGQEKNVSFNDIGEVTVGGTVESDPVITVNVTADTTFVAVGNGDKINMIGNPVRQEETTVQPLTAILTDGCETLTGWTTSSSTSIESSTLAGTMKTNGEYFYTDDFGAQTADWHGPAVKKSLSQSLQDFMFEIGFYLGSSAGQNQCGNVEVDLLDANNLIICKLSLTKHFGELSTLYSEFRAGHQDNPSYVINGNESNTQFKDSFGGIFRVYRQGANWTAQIFQGTSNGFVNVATYYWTDTNGIASMPATQVQARFCQRAGFPVADMQITDIKANKVNSVNDGQVPIIAHAGDTIIFDHQTDIIRLNGMDITKEKAFIGEYFSLNPGVNTLIAEPASSISTVEVRWRDRWR